MPVQTSYSVAQPTAFVGMKGDLNDDVVDTCINAESSAEIPFGSWVYTYAAGGDQAVKQIGGTTLKLVRGVVLHSHAYSKGASGELGDTGLKPKAVMSVLVKGRVWILSESAAVYGDPVFVRNDVDTNENAYEAKGNTANAADESDLIDCSTKARYVSSCGAGELALIEIDMTTA